MTRILLTFFLFGSVGASYGDAPITAADFAGENFGSKSKWVVEQAHATFGPNCMIFDFGSKGEEADQKLLEAIQRPGGFVMARVIATSIDKGAESASNVVVAGPKKIWEPLLHQVMEHVKSQSTPWLTVMYVGNKETSDLIESKITSLEATYLFVSDEQHNKALQRTELE